MDEAKLSLWCSLWDDSEVEVLLFRSRYISGEECTLLAFVFVPLLVRVLVFTGVVFFFQPPHHTHPALHSEALLTRTGVVTFLKLFQFPLGPAAVDVWPSSPAKLSGQAFTCLNATSCFILYSRPPSLPPVCVRNFFVVNFHTLVLESKWKGSFSCSGYIGRD